MYCLEDDGFFCVTCAKLDSFFRIKVWNLQSLHKINKHLIAFPFDIDGFKQIITNATVQSRRRREKRDRRLGVPDCKN